MNKFRNLVGNPISHFGNALRQLEYCKESFLFPANKKRPLPVSSLQ